MPEENRKSKWIYVRWFAIRFLLVVYDIIAVNAACYLALLTRFYVAKQFHSAAAQYIEAYTSYAPYYTILCLVIFCCFSLYSGIWKYAGFNDLNRIVGANVVCFIVHIIGTLILLRGTPLIRMPISFYCLSAFTQTCLITASRFSYRLLLMEKVRVANNGKGATINAMVIGAGGTGKIVLQELEREKTVRPVCALNYKEIGFGSLLDGVPVVNGVENLKGAIEKYRVNFVIIASAVMPQEVRNRIKAIFRLLSGLRRQRDAEKSGGMRRRQGGAGGQWRASAVRGLRAGAGKCRRKICGEIHFRQSGYAGDRADRPFRGAERSERGLGQGSGKGNGRGHQLFLILFPD